MGALPERVAVIGGTGDEGFGLALRWAAAGIEVVIGSRAAERAERAAQELRARLPGARVSGLVNPEAAAAAGVVVVTVPFAGQADIYRSIAPAIAGDTVVVDSTVPVAAAVGAKVTHTLGVWQGSAAQQAYAMLGRTGRMCAGFHTLAAVALGDLEHPLEGDVLVCGDKDGKPVVAELVAAIPDLRYVDAGPLENARIVEPLTALLIGINRRYGADRAGVRITGI